MSAASSRAPDRSGPAIVVVNELAKTYDAWSIRGRKRVDALRGVSLQAHAGDVFGLLGPNGAGKTTLIKMLLGVVKPSRGTASLFGEPIGSTAARLRVGYLPESLRVDKHHTARSALRFYGRLSRMSMKEIDHRSDELLELVGLAGRDRESVRRFSKGMYQRLGLAQALMHDPDLLVLDEPTDGLDPVGRNEVRKVIERMRDLGKTIFLNSHILQEVEMVCTRVAILAEGRIRGMGRIDDLVSVGDTKEVIFEVAVPSEPPDSELQIRSCFEIEPSSLVVKKLNSSAATHRIILSPAPSDSDSNAILSNDQGVIDGAVDRMRQLGFSIVRLESKRPTLEDTFMRLVGTIPPTSTQSQTSETTMRAERY